ncbi:PREDICTED: protein PFC0760c [Vollenhovia emeryi]|uniref:protein PFC0760c n=1 Tax=Vollenhovia emeryi TaxID=411798 RepID=UPI0005F5724A|nr:PREDICTED: protein PFC0760c [Vollenhovia emeryi]
MRLSTIFELLLILLLVAFAAYGRVIDRNEATHRVARAANNVKQSDIDLTTMSLKQATDSVNRYCTCNENICNCCRDFHIPLVQLKGPGCASLQYLQGDNLAVQLSFGDNILTSTIVNGKSPRPVCVPLPGGFTKFCGRIYSIQRDAKNHFKACLGLELQSPTELEATLRVSCFRFGPEGLKLRPAEPLPIVETEAISEEDDDDDFFGLGSDDDDDDDEDDETPNTNSVSDGSEIEDAQESDDDDDDEDDLLGFSALLDIFTGDDEAPTRPKVTTPPPLLEFTIPILPRPTTPGTLEDHEPTFANNEQENNYEEHDDNTQEPYKTEEEDTGITESNTEDSTDENTEASNKIVYTAKPDKAPTANKVKKGVVSDKKKPTVTSTSVNAIHDPEKPAKKPIKDEDDEDDDDDDILDDDDEEIEDEDDDVLDDDDDDDDKDDEDEDEEDEDKLDDEKHEEHDDDEDEKAVDLADLVDDDDDDDEEEDSMLSALIGTGKSKKSKEETKTNQTNVHKHGDEDDDLALELFGRKRHSSEHRQSKITRL